MHYQVNDYIIESELAAKPTSQSNKYVLTYINNLPNQAKILDYGCGKLRYSIPLSNRVAKVVAIDSKYQLEKIQLVNGVKTTIKEYGNNFRDNLFIYCLDSEEWKTQKYNIVFCANVLSAIPNDKYRLEILEGSKKLLDKSGYIFITIQYRNSYFTNYASRINAIKYHDGWLLPRSNDKCSFYGIVTIEKVVELCNIVGLKIFEIKRHDGSLFIKAREDKGTVPAS